MCGDIRWADGPRSGLRSITVMAGSICARRHQRWRRAGQTRLPQVTTALTSGDPIRLAPLFFTDDEFGRSVDRSAIFTAVGARSTLARFARASRSHDAWEKLNSIATPTLVQHGADDLVTGVDHARMLAEAIPDARLDVLPRLRHGYHLESPTAVQTVVAHLRD